MEFYKIHRTAESGRLKFRLERKGKIILEVIKTQDGTIEVVPFRRGKGV